MPFITGGAILAGSLLGADAAGDAAGIQAGAANNATAFQREMFDRTERNLAPWLSQGRVSLDQLAAMTGPNGQLLRPFGMQDFQESPAYQFNLEQGQKAIEKAAAKRGMYYAPATLKDISRFSQGLASNEFNTAYGQYNQNMKNIWDRLYALSSGGQNAAAQIGAFGTTTGGQVGGNMVDAGNAAAAGRIGAANAISGGVNNYLNNSMVERILSNSQRSSVSPSGPMGSFDFLEGFA